MAVGNNNFINEASAIMREPKVKIYVNGAEESIADLLYVEKDSLNFGGAFIGNALPQKLTFRVKNDVSIARNTPIDIQYIFVTTTNEEIASGFVYPTFYVESSTYNRANNSTEITANDALYALANKKFNANTNGTVTPSDFLTSFCSDFNLLSGGIDSEIINSISYMPMSPNFAEEDSALFVLSKFAEMMCGNAYIKNKTELHIRSPFSGISASLACGRGLKILKSEETLKINRVVLSRGDVNDNVSYPESPPTNVCEYSFLNNPFLDNNDSNDSRGEYIDLLYNHLNGKEFTGYEVSYRGNPAYECGDAVQFDLLGNGIPYMYYGEKLIMSNGMSGKAQVKFDFLKEASFSSGTLKDSIKQVNIKVNRTNAEISSIVADIKEQQSQMSQDITGFTFEIASINEKLDKGTEELSNTLITINKEGVTVGQSGEDTVSVIDARGLHINDTAGGKVAEFTEAGSVIRSVIAKTVNTAGSIFKLVTVDGETWGACYWIGEDELWD